MFTPYQTRKRNSTGFWLVFKTENNFFKGSPLRSLSRRSVFCLRKTLLPTHPRRRPLHKKTHGRTYTRVPSISCRRTSRVDSRCWRVRWSCFRQEGRSTYKCCLPFYLGTTLWFLLPVTPFPDSPGTPVTIPVGSSFQSLGPVSVPPSLDRRTAGTTRSLGSGRRGRPSRVFRALSTDRSFASHFWRVLVQVNFWTLHKKVTVMTLLFGLTVAIMYNSVPVWLCDPNYIQ